MSDDPDIAEVLRRLAYLEGRVEQMEADRQDGDSAKRFIVLARKSGTEWQEQAVSDGAIVDFMDGRKVEDDAANGALIPRGSSVFLFETQDEHGRRYVEITADSTFPGIVVCDGPNGEQDGAENVYWVKRARIANSGGGDGDKVEFEELDPADPLFWHGAVTNQFEDNCATHFVRPGTRVTVHVGYDQSDPPVARYWTTVADEGTCREAPCSEGSSSASSGSSGSSASSSGSGSSSASESSSSASDSSSSQSSQSSSASGSGSGSGSSSCVEAIKAGTLSATIIPGEEGECTVQFTYETILVTPCVEE